MRRTTRFIAATAVLALGLAACGGGSSSGGGGGGGSATCPTKALDSATGPVKITFWHEMTRANEEALVRLTKQFNDSQSKIQVTLVNQTGYKEALQKFRAGLSSGDLPNVVQIEDTATQQMIDTQAVLPAQACIDATKYDTSDYVKRVLDYYTVDGTQYPMPFNVSNPILYYDKNGFRAAGLDPNKPPATLDEVRAAAKKLQTVGYKYGWGLKLDPWYLEQWSAKAGKLYANNENGRAKRATEVVFDNPTGLEIFSWMQSMVADGIAVTNSADGANAYNNLLGIRSKDVGMTIDTSAALGTIDQVLRSGDGGGVDVGIGPMPGPAGNGGVLVGGAALYLVKKGSSPAQQAASFEFTKWLNSPEIQADWSASTGYVPTRMSATKQPILANKWAQSPNYRVAYDQLVNGPNNAATSGPVIGAYQAVRDAILIAQQKMYTQNLAPAKALAEAKTGADAAILEYNQRVGG
jgi:sn-glycerol 3-phosphate transport system substrate-binding protein